MRRVGVIVDGDSEYYALPQLLRRIPDTQSQVVATLLAPIPPTASPGVIAQSCRSRIQILIKKNVHDIIILIDRENVSECPGSRALTIAAGLSIPTSCQGYVVLKDRMFENWLVADLDALKRFPKRYKITSAAEKKILAGQADTVNAMKFLHDVTQPDYDKTADSQKILSAADPMNIGMNSRSFRRLLRVLGNQTYSSQSQKPASIPTPLVQPSS